MAAHRQLAPRSDPRASAASRCGSRRGQTCRDASLRSPGLGNAGAHSAVQAFNLPPEIFVPVSFNNPGYFSLSYQMANLSIRLGSSV